MGEGGSSVRESASSSEPDRRPQSQLFPKRAGAFARMSSHVTLPVESSWCFVSARRLAVNWLLGFSFGLISAAVERHGLL